MSQHFLCSKDKGVDYVMVGTDRYLILFGSAFRKGDSIAEVNDLTPYRDLDGLIAWAQKFAIVPPTLRAALEAELANPAASMNRHFRYDRQGQPAAAAPAKASL